MALVRVVCNVQIQLVNVPVILDTKELNVMLLAVVIQLVQVARHVILLQVNALVILDTLEPHVTLVPPTTIEPVVEPVQVIKSYFHPSLLKI